MRASSSYVNAAPPPPDLFRIEVIDGDADVPVDCVNEGMIGGGACKFVIVQLALKVKQITVTLDHPSLPEPFRVFELWHRLLIANLSSNYTHIALLEQNYLLLCLGLVPVYLTRLSMVPLCWAIALDFDRTAFDDWTNDCVCGVTDCPGLDCWLSLVLTICWGKKFELIFWISALRFIKINSTRLYKKTTRKNTFYTKAHKKSSKKYVKWNT